MSCYLCDTLSHNLDRHSVWYSTSDCAFDPKEEEGNSDSEGSALGEIKTPSPSKSQEMYTFDVNSLHIDDASCDSDNAVLLFVYGTLKRNYCNHYHFEIDGVEYFQDAVTVLPFVLYMDKENRNRPCLIEEYKASRSPQTLRKHATSSLCNVSDGSNPKILPEQRERSQTSGGRSLVGQNGRSNSCSIPLVRAVRRTKSVTGPLFQARNSKGENLTTIPNANTSSGLPSIPTQTEEIRRTCSLDSIRLGKPVRGELYKVSRDLLPALDEFERCPTQYCRKTIQVRGCEDRRLHFAEVYFISDTPQEKWHKLVRGEFECLDDYTMEHHSRYSVREGNNMGKKNHSRISELLEQKKAVS
eukprot:Selendium_serpulae@DN7999_c0_g1_i1.p1